MQDTETSGQEMYLMDQIQSCLAQVCGSAYTEYWKIWIDYKNGVLKQLSKLFLVLRQSANLTATFTVPTTALSGPTRMRVSMKYNAAQTACETFHMEVEDYTVNIGGAIAGFTTSFRVDENNIFEYTMSPNPTSDFFKYNDRF
jgi:hypothetical protein